MSRSALRVAVSPCPNDTFASYGIAERKVASRLKVAFELADIQELNRAAERGTHDVCKVSFAAAFALEHSHQMLPMGAAIGYGVGPLLVAADEGTPIGPNATVLCPGKDTTATLIFKRFHPQATHIRHTRFSDIMPAVARGDAAFGVVIHEGRFTYRSYGLFAVEDLGERWERETGHPTPLGCLVGKRSTSPEILEAFGEMFRESLSYARAHPREVLGFMQCHAQELTEEVIWRHVKLYVNESTFGLSPRDLAAVEELRRQSRAV